MANSKIYYVLGNLVEFISTAYVGLAAAVTIVLRNVNGWLEAYVWPPLDFREPPLFRCQQRLQMAMARVRLNVARLTAYWRRQHHRRVNRNAGWYLIEKPIWV
jgi:hypothetical protein